MRETLFTLKLNSIDLLFQKKIKLFSRILVFLQFSSQIKVVNKQNSTQQPYFHEFFFYLATKPLPDLLQLLDLRYHHNQVQVQLQGKGDQFSKMTSKNPMKKKSTPQPGQQDEVELSKK